LSPCPIGLLADHTPPARHTRRAMGNNLAPASFSELVQFAQMAAKSQLVPKEYRNQPEDRTPAALFQCAARLIIDVAPRTSIVRSSRLPALVI
jgi:hypothetical protein